MRRFFSILFLALSFCACKKNQAGAGFNKDKATGGYITYTILQGQHYCDKTNLQTFSNSELIFNVRFDSSAIYHSFNPVNQNDVNKLSGFSEGPDHHTNSARIGWAWNDNRLRLYAYVYSGGHRLIKEITAITIGAAVQCKVVISADKYVLTVDGVTVSLNRSLTGAPVTGYWLFPYFGGDETAPHDIRIEMQHFMD